MGVLSHQEWEVVPIPFPFWLVRDSWGKQNYNWETKLAVMDTTSWAYHQRNSWRSIDLWGNYSPVEMSWTEMNWIGSTRMFGALDGQRWSSGYFHVAHHVGIGILYMLPVCFVVLLWLPQEVRGDFAWSLLVRLILREVHWLWHCGLWPGIYLALS